MASQIDELSDKVGGKWPAILRARDESIRVKEQVQTMLGLHRLVPTDTSFVAFGSLAREEWTHGSDIDWTLLVDGHAHPEHHDIALRINGRLKDIHMKDPGQTGTFGVLAFSHDIIHHIGGEADTNRNTTRRILLVLESVALGDAEAYQRVLRSVLQRYLDGDISFITSSGRYKVPRFLLNDISRYWRTVCVDYATKNRERAGHRWALRNAKLRMSRKLIFAAGVLMCFSCQLQNLPAKVGLFATLELEPLLSHLIRYVGMPPLAILADALLRYAKPETAKELMDAYNEFLKMLDDTEARERLEKLRQDEAKTEPVFRAVKEMSDHFDAALIKFFFDDNVDLGQLTRTYGVF